MMNERILNWWKWTDGGGNCKMVEEDNWNDGSLVQEETWKGSDQVEKVE